MINLEGVEILLESGSPIDVEIKRNAKVIVTTLEGEVPYDRNFGISPEILDSPLNEARDLYTVECVTKLRKYEPRAIVENISFSFDEMNGKLNPKVVLSIEFE